MSHLPVVFHTPTASDVIDPQHWRMLEDEGMPTEFEQRFFFGRMRTIIGQLNALSLTVPVAEVQGQAPDITYPQSVEIDVLLLPQEAQEYISASFGFEQAPMGFYAQTTGEGVLGEEEFNPRHQVVVFVPDDAQYQKMLAEHMEEMGVDLNRAQRDFENTLTHEISHVLLFAQASGGLSSYDIDGCFDDGSFPFDRHSVTTGRELRDFDMYYANCVDQDHEVEVMEELVEERGHRLLDQLYTPKRVMKP